MVLDDDGGRIRGTRRPRRRCAAVHRRWPGVGYVEDVEAAKAASGRVTIEGGDGVVPVVPLPTMPGAGVEATVTIGEVFDVGGAEPSPPVVPSDAMAAAGVGARGRRRAR